MNNFFAGFIRLGFAREIDRHVFLERKDAQFQLFAGVGQSLQSE